VYIDCTAANAKVTPSPKQIIAETYFTAVMMPTTYDPLHFCFRHSHKQHIINKLRRLIFSRQAMLRPECRDLRRVPVQYAWTDPEEHKQPFSRGHSPCVVAAPAGSGANWWARIVIVDVKNFLSLKSAPANPKRLQACGR
jgi:hypothetical protein